MQFNRLESQQTRIIERINSEGGRREEVRGPERNSNIKYIFPEFQGDTSSHYLIERSLAGPPGDWCQIIKDDVNNFQTFLDKFLKRYWNEQAQHELRRKLELGSHTGDRTRSRTESAIRMEESFKIK